MAKWTWNSRTARFAPTLSAGRSRAFGPVRTATFARAEDSRQPRLAGPGAAQQQVAHHEVKGEHVQERVGIVGQCRVGRVRTTATQVSTPVTRVPTPSVKRRMRRPSDPSRRLVPGLPTRTRSRKVEQRPAEQAGAAAPSAWPPRDRRSDRTSRPCRTGPGAGRRTAAASRGTAARPGRAAACRPTGSAGLNQKLVQAAINPCPGAGAAAGSRGATGVNLGVFIGTSLRSWPQIPGTPAAGPRSPRGSGNDRARPG